MEFVGASVGLSTLECGSNGVITGTEATISLIVSKNYFVLELNWKRGIFGKFCQ